MKAQDLTRRQARWSLFLNRFTFVIEHRPGRLSDGPDALSRRPDFEIGTCDNTQQTLLGPERVPPKHAACVVLEAHRLSEKEHRAAVGREVLGKEEILERIRVASEQDEQFAAVCAKDQAPAAVRNK